jgi:hypothetical protein
MPGNDLTRGTGFLLFFFFSLWAAAQRSTSSGTLVDKALLTKADIPTGYLMHKITYSAIL